MQVGPDLVGCRLVKRNLDGSLLWGVVVETEAYSQDEPACHGYHRRSKNNETLFSDPGHFYVYVIYGIHFCVNVVTDRSEWASGVLLRALAMPDEPERVASGPGLLSKRFGMNLSDNSAPVTGEYQVWLAPRPVSICSPNIINTTRIGITKGEDLPLRWYLHSSRSVSRRARGDRNPLLENAWVPSSQDQP